MVSWNSTSCTNSCLWSVWELSVPQTSSFSCWYGTELCVRYIFCQNGSDVLNSASELLALSKFLVRFYKLCMMWIGWKMKRQNVGCRICSSTWRARIDESVYTAGYMTEELRFHIQQVNGLDCGQGTPSLLFFGYRGTRPGPDNDQFLCLAPWLSMRGNVPILLLVMSWG